MANEIYLSLLSLVTIAIVASGFVWMRFLYRWLTGQKSPQDLVPAEPRERPFWTLADILITFGALILGLVLFSSLFAQLGWIESAETSESNEDAAASLHSLVANIAANSLAGIFAVAVTIGWLSLLNPKAIEKLGIIPTRAGILLGLCGSLWILPPVSIIAGIVSLLVPYEHPVLDTLSESPTPWLFAGMFIGTAVVAPFVEEFMFRVIMQGSLEGLADGPKPGLTAENATLTPLEALVAAETTNEIADAYRPPREQPNVFFDSASQSPVSQNPAAWAPTHYWPIVVASLVFASMHLGQGAAPIPLFMLSLCLGYLYRQTGRITASLLVHMVLNAVTLCVEFMRILAEAG